MMKKIIYLMFLTVVTILQLNAQRNYKNEKNPYDYVGTKHNEGVIKLLNRIEENKIENFKQVVSEYIKIDSKFKILAEKITKSKKPMSFNSNNLSAEGKTIYTSLINCINKAKTGDDVYNCLFGLEESILANSNLKKEESITLLAVASVARHSTYLWSNAEMDGKDNTKNSFLFKLKINWKRVKEIVKADLEGAAVGAGIGGSIAGVGAAAGAVGGAVIGSCCNSIAINPNGTSTTPVELANRPHYQFVFKK